MTNSDSASLDHSTRLEFARSVALAASELILHYYQDPDLTVERKGDSSPVTEADRNAELLIRHQLSRQFPDDGILGEEFPSREGTTGYQWIVDPIDGTKSFIHGVPLFGTLIGIEYNSKPVIGVVRFPALDETVFAALGQGAWHQIGKRPPRQVHVSTKKSLNDSTFCFTNPSRWFSMGRGATFETLLSSVQLARGWGDCYGHMLVATGRAEVMIDPAMNPWDAAALLPIIEEAGGHFVDWSGNPTIHGGNGVSVVPGIKDEILRLIGQNS